MLVLSGCLLLVLRVFAIEPFAVPSGSMAPTIRGRHRLAVCPRCGALVAVGCYPADDKRSRTSCSDHACCPNCGCDRLDLAHAPESGGDQLLVNKNVFLFRRPRRWEVIVFRLFGKVFIKRVIGLAGEEIEIIDGDVYVDGQLARKTLDEARAVRILVFDNDCAPGPDGWQSRWEMPAGQSGPHPLAGGALHLDGTRSADNYQCVGYRHYQLDTQKCEAVRDEYAYNGGEQRSADAVHDFLLECDVTVEAGCGHVALSLTDGQDTLIAEIPVGDGGGPRALVVRAPVKSTTEDGGLFRPTRTPGEVFAVAHPEPLRPGRTHHVEMAFVDRRLSLRIDGRSPVGPVDLPPAARRPGVERPVTLGARGARVVVSGFRLFRDVHYTQAGNNAVRGKAVHLQAGQYFVLGDNSPCSDDSRFWPDGGAVPADSLVGKPFLIHLPTRIATWEALGRQWQLRLPDWGRVRWLR
jgi:signal peptidase I